MARPHLRPYSLALPLLGALLTASPALAQVDLVEDESGNLTLQAGPADSAPAAPPADAVDACALLTKEEMSKIAGSALKGRRPYVLQYPNGRLVTSSCTYTTKESRLTARITVERGRTPEELAGYLETLQEVAVQTSGTPLKPVSGLGDQAHWGQISPTNGILHVIKGTEVLSITTSGKGPGAGTLQKTQELMALVFPRFAALPPAAAP